MLKVQLVFVPPQVEGKLAEFGERIGPPMGILYIASYIKEKIPGIEISVLDGLLLGYSGTIAKIKEFKPDILGLSFNTPVAESAYNLIREIKKTMPGMIVLAGGAHTTSLPEEVLIRSGADIAVIGEGEDTVLELVRIFNSAKSINTARLGSVAGLAFIENGKTVRTADRHYIKDLDTIPLPDRNLVRMPEYRGWYLCKQTPETIMIFSRGCPFQCTFCSNKVWNISVPRVRLRSPENIVDEIELLKKDFGIREIFDNSDEFNNNLEHAKNICREMIKRNTAVTWKTQLRAYPLDEELVELMSKSGCWYVHLGIESGNQQTLDGIGKKITLAQVQEACMLLKRYKIKVLGLFMLFNVWDDSGLKYEDLTLTLNTLNFAKKLVKSGLIDYLGWSITTPYPGSPLYEIALNNDLLKPHIKGNWDAWIKDDFFVMQLPGISDRDIARIKTKGSILRGICLLKSGGFSIKDLGYLIKKVLKIFENEIKSKLK